MLEDSFIFGNFSLSWTFPRLFWIFSCFTISRRMQSEWSHPLDFWRILRCLVCMWLLVSSISDLGLVSCRSPQKLWIRLEYHSPVPYLQSRLPSLFFLVTEDFQVCDLWKVRLCTHFCKVLSESLQCLQCNRIFPLWVRRWLSTRKSLQSGFQRCDIGFTYILHPPHL